MATGSPGLELSITARGAKLFQQTCAAFHGLDGRDGLAPGLTRMTMDGSGTFPSIEVLTRMHEGGDAMPAFRDLVPGPTLVVEIEEGNGTPVPEDMMAIWRYLETIQRPELQSHD
ncbi:c-type cytochrome [Roseivivax halotolerans]|uniref:c-type cytochrome n=1 Tax=Roseivivax halotolerans TaxID=93684 RepID=UPI001113A194|nr:cytochrome c [Roseivivax halotolerans]